MTWGEHLETLENVFEQTGITPKALQDRPEIFPFIEDFYNAFLVLYKHKKNQDVPIQIVDITGYSQLFPQMNDNELLMLVVSTADSVCLNFKKEQNENGRNNKDSNA